ncbi:class B sortase [Paenibacillus sp. S3N08]|uniref:Class B sortase n=2 Tax=Paenibacillus agricola TaxID=2716264 RepID=A0ABX0J555_9BACL|nr:class B sortase [Paenibacillus agricola]
MLMCLAVIVYCLASLYNVASSYYSNKMVTEEAREIYTSGRTVQWVADGNAGDSASKSPNGTVNDSPSNDKMAKARPQFHALLSMNADISGWLKIDDTPVDYPIVQAKDNDYYLTRNFKREAMRAGSMFMDYRNQSAGSSLNTIIYGHDMRDGSMFGSLNQYLKADFFDTHRSFGYDTLEESYQAEIFAVYFTTTDVNYIMTHFPDDEAYYTFLQDMQARSLYETNTSLASTDRIITLSTCDYTLDAEEGRLVVQAKLVKR